MKKTIISGAIGIMAVATPFLALADTYAYVNTSGSVSTVQANSAFQAMTVSNIAQNSGVMLVSNSLTVTSQVPAQSTTSTVGVYQYVDTSGRISTVQANSASQALSVSNIDPNSGVMLVR